MAKQEYTFERLKTEIKAKRFVPVYILYGEEAYFIDRLEEAIVQNALDEADRAAFTTYFYGVDTKVKTVIAAARQYPMGSERQVIVVREAQSIKGKDNSIDLFAHYFRSPMPQTILVICLKYTKKLDARKSWLTEAKKVGIVFESKKIYDNKMPEFIESFLKERSLDTNVTEARLLADYIGDDICKLEKVVEKLQLAMYGSPSKRITPEIIEKYIGINNDFNAYKFIGAIAARDVLKANRIAEYFANNPKDERNIVPVLSNLFDYFVKLMICIYASAEAKKTRKYFSVKETLGIQYDILAVDYVNGMKNFNGIQVFNSIHEIRLADARAKGFAYSNSDNLLDIYRELLYKILH